MPRRKAEPPITPTYAAQGGRGKHRLFRWTVELPFADKAVFKIGELEFRTGNGQKGAQSVLPPSIHPTGGKYQWLIPPEDCDPAELPGDFLARVESFQ